MSPFAIVSDALIVIGVALVTNNGEVVVPGYWGCRW